MSSTDIISATRMTTLDLTPKVGLVGYGVRPAHASGPTQ